MLKSVKEAKVGNATIRLLRDGSSFRGVVIVGKSITEEVGQDADDVWRRLHDAVGRLNPSYFGFDGARARFLRFFPNGFHSPEYESGERGYKLQAKAKLEGTAPLEHALSGSGFGESVLAVFRATNLLSPFEKTRLQDLLRGPQADDFVRGAARFASGDLKIGLGAMAEALRPHDNAKWTVATYLPYLWRPDKHMFLKPTVTKDFAERVGHSFAHRYEPRLDIPVYESLLDLVRRTEHEIVDLKPRDRIDVQSFIWVIGGYDETTKSPAL